MAFGGEGTVDLAGGGEIFVSREVGDNGETLSDRGGVGCLYKIHFLLF